MNNRRRQRLKALDMRIRSKSGGLLNLKTLREYACQALRDYRNQTDVCAWPDVPLVWYINKYADCADIVKF